MRLIASSLLAGLLAVTAVAPAFADDDHRRRTHDRRDDHRRHWDDRDYRHGYRDGYRHERRDDRRDRRGWYDDRGGHHYWSRGDRFDRRHHTSYVVVNDYYRYRLPPPRHGHDYYRDHDTGEVLLIAAATGLVLWALTN